MKERYEFDEVTLLSAFAVGAPGKRTFFLLIGQKEEWVRVWLEKVQLEALALAIEQFLFTLSKEHHTSPGKIGKTLSDNVPPGMPSAELEIDQITLGYDREIAALNFEVHSLGPQKLDHVVLNCRVTLAHLKNLGNQARSICAAGRPLCILCGRPIDPTGHICPSSN